MKSVLWSTENPAVLRKFTLKPNHGPQGRPPSSGLSVSTDTNTL